MSKTLCELCPLHGAGWTLRQWILDGATAFVFFGGLAAIVGYLLNLDYMDTSWMGSDDSGMSFQTALCVTVLAARQLVRNGKDQP